MMKKGPALLFLIFALAFFGFGCCFQRFGNVGQPGKSYPGIVINYYNDIVTVNLEGPQRRIFVLKQGEVV